MISQVVLSLLLLIFTVGGIGIVLCQVNIAWQSWRGAQRNKQQLTALSNAQPLSLKVIARQELTERHFSVRLQRVNNKTLTHFLPGQYLTLMVENQSMKGSLVKGVQKRCYSLASWQENTDSYELAIQREVNGQVSTWLHSNLQIGTIIKALPPKGSFVIEPKQVRHIVLVAGGIGITPLRAMVHQFIAEIANDSSAKKTISLFYSAKTANEMCYFAEFTQLAQQYSFFTFYTFLSKPENANSELNWQGTIGRISAEQLTQKLELAENSHQSSKEKFIDKTTCHYYMCGPNAMMDDLKHGLIQQGISEANINFERFGVNIDTIGDEKFTIKLGENVCIEFRKQRTLLDAIQEQGIEIESECRTGECGQCKIKLQQGRVKQLIASDAYLNDGEILTCCSVPISDLVIEI